MLFLITINCGFKFCKNYEVCFPTHLSIFISFPLYKYITMMLQIETLKFYRKRIAKYKEEN